MVRARTRSVVLVLTLTASVLAAPHSTVRARPLAEAVPSNIACDPIDPAACLLPFPNDLFTRPATPADTSATGKVVNFTPDAMPRSGTDVTNGGEGKPIDPTEHNRNDGFSPGSMVMTYVPNIDLHQTWGTADRPHSDMPPNEEGYFDHRDHIADPALYLRDDAPIVIINTTTGERHPFWSELDSHRDALAEGERRLLLMRPARNFDEGTRYVVALRNLKDASGTVIQPPNGPTPTDFVDLRDGSYLDPLRQDHFDTNVFPVLETAGLARDDLYLAWDFTVASEQNLAGRILSMRDQAFGTTGNAELDAILGRLGDTTMADRLVQGRAPTFKIDSVEERVDTDVEPDQEYRRIHGRVTVPNFMDRLQQTEGHAPYETPYAPQMPFDFPAPGSRLLDVNRDGQPEQNPTEPTVQVPFVCDVPTNGQENNVVLYGHGLLGMRDQIFDARRSPGRQGPFFGCAADWWGMSTADAPTVAAILLDVSNFPSLPDRAQQGFLNFMFLGRVAIHPDGFATDPNFQEDGESLINVADEGEKAPLYYDGNSQGGIMGGALVAVSPDIQRGILGVTGMNYSTLLNRSVDWEGELNPPDSQEDVEELIEDLQDDPADAITGTLGAYSVPFYALYRDPIERQLIFSLMQMLWDRGESNGYAHHLADDPLPNTPPHDVMLQLAWSDHQVANVSAEVEARTIDAPIMVPGLPDGEHWEMDPYFTETASYPYEGSALVYWDSGNATPPNANIPPHHNGDPHGHPRSENAAGWQEAHFLLTGQMADVCDGRDYLTGRHPAVRADSSLRCVAPSIPPGTIVDPDPTVTATPTGPIGTASASPTEDPGPRATTVAFTENSATTGQFSDPVTLEVQVTDTTSGDPVADREVTFQLAGTDSARTFTAATDASGVARVTETLTERPGEFQLTARSAADEDRLAGADSEVFVVDKEDTSLRLDVTGNGSKRAAVAVLTDGDSGAGVADRDIRFDVDGERIGTATTDGSGRAEQPVPPRYRGGRHEFVAHFAGDDYYRTSTARRST